MYINIKDKILYEDSEILVCKKPAGVAVQTAKMGQQDMVSLLKNYRMQQKEEPYIGLIHRLDQPVEGVMLFAKNKKSAADLSRQVSERSMDKCYYAVVLGKLEEKSKTMENYLVRDGKTNMSRVADESTEGAKVARLAYEVLAESNQKSLVRIQLETGRHHQIRVQFSQSGHPLYGDNKYGEKTVQGYMPLALCSYKIGFLHPKTKKKMQFEIVPEGKAFDEFASQFKKS